MSEIAESSLLVRSLLSLRFYCGCVALAGGLLVLAYYLNPFLYAFAVIGVGLVSVPVAACGFLVPLRYSHRQGRSPVPCFVAAVLLLAVAAVGFLVLKSVNWA